MGRELEMKRSAVLVAYGFIAGLLAAGLPGLMAAHSLGKQAQTEHERAEKEHAGWLYAAETIAPRLCEDYRRAVVLLARILGDPRSRIPTEVLAEINPNVQDLKERTKLHTFLTTGEMPTTPAKISP
jgi:hypothetical protein